MSESLAGINGDEVGTELGEFGEDESMDALANRGEENNTGNADRDSQRGQNGPQAVRSDGFERVPGKISH